MSACERLDGYEGVVSWIRRIPCNEECRICDSVRAHSNVSLLNKFNSLDPSRIQKKGHSARFVARTALTVSAIFDMHMKTANLRLQNAATVSLLSTSLSFAEVFSTPMS